MDFENTLESHRREVEVYVLSRLKGIVGDRHSIAEDLTQQTLINAWKGQKGYTGRDRFEYWLRVIACNVCNDYMGRLRPIEGEITEYPDERPSQIETVLADDGRRVRVNQAIVVAMTVNSPLQRRIALLAAADVPFSQISTITGLSSAAIFRRMHKLLRLINDERSRLSSNRHPRCTPEVGNADHPGKEDAGGEDLQADRRIDLCAGRGPKITLESNQEAPRHRRNHNLDDVRRRDEPLCVSAA